MTRVLQAKTQLNDTATDFVVYAIIIFACLFYKMQACSTLVMMLVVRDIQHCFTLDMSIMTLR